MQRFKNNASIYRSNSIVPSDYRTYGLLKALRSNTPNPVAKTSVDRDKLREKLQRMSNIESSNEDESSMSSGTLKSGMSLTKSEFEKKRKLFDTAEFTIAKGKKMSENFHPNSPIHGDTVERTNMDDIKRYIHEMRLTISR
ncbi:uncharacterized protein [Drosophila bipectinata]|uniref:uncharacterized protein n=1 Tax=Drosophila bipectinata TaxID=42026 RepID=UPI001C8A75C0|nr:uncharacterized protein LOC108129693 [Drosophila bipectinata]